MAFNVGTKVIHPAYGAGEIIAIKERELGQHVNEYYVIRMPAQNMTVMVPTDKADEIGLRPVSQQKTIAEMWDVLGSAPGDLSDEYKERQERIREQLRSGDILEIAEVLRDLRARQEDQKLTQADKGLMDQAENFVAGELALAHNMDVKDARALIRSRLDEQTNAKA